jgi:hypothetical protein
MKLTANEIRDVLRHLEAIRRSFFLHPAPPSFRTKQADFFFPLHFL